MPGDSRALLVTIPFSQQMDFPTMSNNQNPSEPRPPANSTSSTSKQTLISSDSSSDDHDHLHPPISIVNPLTRDHKPEDEFEQHRLQKGWADGTVPRTGFIKKQRVWFSCDRGGLVSGLNMSRSLGDRFAHEVGVSSEPEISVASVDLSKKNGGHFLLLASDGLFEVMDNEAAGDRL